MSRATLTIKEPCTDRCGDTCSGGRRVYPNAYPDPANGVLEVFVPCEGARTINLADIEHMNGQMASLLVERGYDVSGLRAAFWYYHFHGFDDTPGEIQKDLGEDFYLETEEGSTYAGTIRRSLRVRD